MVSLLSSYRVFYFSFLPPKLFKSGGIGGRIADGVLNVAMAEVILNEPGIRALISQGEAAGMAEHVGVRGQGQPGQFPIMADGRPDGFAVERPAPFTDKKIIPRRFHSFPFFEPCLDQPQFIGPQRVRGGQALFEPGDMQDPAFGIHLREFQPAGFRDPQAVAEQQQHQAAVAGLVARAFDGGEELVHFQAGEVFAVIHRFVPCGGFPPPYHSTACGRFVGKHRTK